MKQCTFPAESNDPTSCSICDRVIKDWVICTGCSFRYCRECVKTELSGPVVCECCPGCANWRRMVCPSVTMRKRAPVPVALIFIYVEDFLGPTHNLMNTVVGALEGGEVQVATYMLTMRAALENNAEYYAWLKNLHVSTTLFIFLVTETVLNGGWVWTGQEDRGWSGEIELLNGLFTSHEIWASKYRRLRQGYLFIVSCGGNFSQARNEPNLPQKITDWIKQKGVFSNVIAFLNSRLVVAETQQFFSLLVTAMCVHHTPFKEALIKAFCHDEYILTHSGILWLTARHPALALRYSGGARFCGLSPPYLCMTNCGAHSAQRRIERRKAPEGQVIWRTLCCKQTYLLVADNPNQLPQEIACAGTHYILENWPGGFTFKIQRVS